MADFSLLKMKASALDPCFFYKIGPNGIEGLQVTQVNDTCGGRSSDFSVLVATKAKQFSSKPRSSRLPLKFNGLWINKFGEDGYQMHENNYAEQVEQSNSIRDFKNPSKLFQPIRGNISYITTCTRPDLSFISTRLSHVSADKITNADYALLNSACTKLRKPLAISIPKLDLSSLYIAGYPDASIAKNHDLTSQHGFIVVLKDQSDNAAIIQYGSRKCNHVTRSVLGAEFLAFSHCLDYVLP